MAGRDLSLEVSFDAEVPSLQNSTLYANGAELDMSHDFEFSRNHWAVKDVDFYRFLLRNVRPAASARPCFKSLSTRILKLLSHQR